MHPERLIIYTDGASSGNPGPASIGVVIKDGQGKVISRISQGIGRATNNHAEYQAVIAALDEASRLGARAVDIKSDSELVVKQLNGSYRVRKDSLKPLFRQAMQLKAGFTSCPIHHIPRSQNRRADALANRALNQT